MLSLAVKEAKEKARDFNFIRVKEET